MNSERSYYQQEEKDDDDSHSLPRASFGRGPAFKPVEQHAPAPRVEQGRIGLSGILYERPSLEKDPNDEDDDSEDKEALPSRRRVTPPLSAVTTVEGYHAPHTEYEIADLETKAEETNESTEIEPVAPEPLRFNQPLESPRNYGESFTANEGEEPNIPAPRQPVRMPSIPRVQAPEFTFPVSEVQENEPEATVFSNSQPAASTSSYASGRGNTPPSPNQYPAFMFNTPPSPNNANAAPAGPPPPTRPTFNNYAGGFNQPPQNPNMYNSIPSVGAATAAETAPVATPAPRKKRNPWPYIAVAAENLARKRADRKLEKKLTERMDQQEDQIQETAAQQLRYNQQQQRFSTEQHYAKYAKPVTGEQQQRPLGQSELPPMPAIKPPEGLEPASNPALKPNQHRVRSSWHEAVIDNQGRVETDAIQYGQGFEGERRSETGQTDNRADDTNDFAAPLPSQQAAGHYQYLGGAQQYRQPALQSGMTNPSLPTGAPTHVDPQHQLPEHSQKSSQLPGPVFWMMILLIIIAFVVAATI